MDLLPGVGDTMSGRNLKNHTPLVYGIMILVGMLIGAGIVAFLFRDAVFLNIPKTNIETLSYPNGQSQKVSNLKTNILLPKKLVSEDYYLLINKIVNELNQVVENNNTTILPLMNAIKQKSVAKDFGSLFDLMIQARGEVKKNSDILVTTRGDIAVLKKVNADTTSDTDVRGQTAVFLTSGDTFVQAFEDYFALISETLSGSVPTQDLLNRLSEKGVLLSNTGSSFQSELDTLLTLMKQKIQTDTP